MSAEKKLTIEDILKEVQQTARDAGWHDSPRTIVEDLCLVHTEISEAVEDIRNGREPTEMYYDKRSGGATKPCGVPSELADVLIRVLHIAAKFDIDIAQALKEKMEFNRTRPYRHGGKKL